VITTLKEENTMSRKQRKNYPPEEKVIILKKHLLEKVPVSDLCDQYGLHPTVFHRSMKEFFENAALAFQKDKDTRSKRASVTFINLFCRPFPRHNRRLFF
jgi:transposase